MGEGKQGQRKACWRTQRLGKSHEIPRLPLLGITSKAYREGATLYDLRDFFAVADRDEKPSLVRHEGRVQRSLCMRSNFVDE